MQLPAADGSFGPGFFSAFKQAWAATSSKNPIQNLQDYPSLSQDFPQQDCAPELHGLLDTLQTLRRRMLANIFVGGGTALSAWILIGLIAVLAISARPAFPIILAAILAAVGAAVMLVWIWRGRLSIYETACRLDSTAGLQERISTAIYLGATKNPAGLIERQRMDALARIAKLNLRGLFRLRAPVGAWRALALVLLASGLYAYRLHHKPPLLALLQTTARSRLVQSILSPLVHAMEKDLQRAAALVASKPEVLADETRPGDSALTGDDLWKSGDDKAAGDKQGEQDSLEAGDTAIPQDQLQPPGDQNGSPSEQSEQEGNDSPQSPGGPNSSQSSAANSQQQGSQGSQNQRESLSQSLLQALKNMMSNSPNQQSSNRGNQQPQQPDSQGASQSGNSHQPGNSESDKKGDSHGSSDAKQKATESASNGAGSQAGSKEMNKELAEHPVNAVPDRVALESSGFKEQTRMRVDTETGAAQLALRDVSPRSEAVINGAEQENIPPRYRLYVQRYFEHADTAKQ